MERYNCKVCGKKHPLFHGMKSPIPSVLSELSDQWVFHEIDEVPTYQIDLHGEEEKLQQVAAKLFNKVFLMDESQIEIDSFEI